MAKQVKVCPPKNGLLSIREKREVARRQYRREVEQLERQGIDPDRVQEARLLRR